jgi:hypothetical protein
MLVGSVGGQRWSSSWAVDRFGLVLMWRSSPRGQLSVVVELWPQSPNPWHLSRALIYHSSAATLADQVAASPTLLVCRYQANGIEGIHARSKRPQVASRAILVESSAKIITCTSSTASGREHLGVPQALPRRRSSWGAGRGGYSEDQKFSLLSHGNLGSLCNSLWSSGIIDREEAGYGR